MTTLRSAMLGSWVLVTFEARDTATGTVRRPMGAHPRGVVLYTEDGYMSAQLAPGDSAAELGDYIAYTGPFHVDEQNAIVHHDVVMATMPDLLATPQLREVGFDGDRLVLSATLTDDTGATTHSTLTWQRAVRQEEPTCRGT